MAIPTIALGQRLDKFVGLFGWRIFKRMRSITDFPINSLPDGLVMLDAKGRIIAVNAQFCEITGFDELELLNISAFEFIPLEHCFRIQAGYKKLVSRKGLRLNVDIPLRHKNNHLLLVDTAVLNLLHQPDIGACIVQVRDETKKKKEEKRRWEAAILEAQENEKLMIAAELHDNINQLLLGSLMFIGSFAAKQPLTDPLVARSKELLEEAVEEIRNVATVLSGNLVKKISLERAVNKLATMLEEAKNLKTKLEIDKRVSYRLSHIQQLHLYRIIQEQYNNICRHAKATSVHLSLGSIEGKIRLLMHDNGKGFSGNSAPIGLGIQNMQYRIQMLGGMLTISSERGKGTLLKALIPMENAGTD